MIYDYTINPDSDEPIMLINDDIGYDLITGRGIDGEKFLKEILSLDEQGKKRIKIYINSMGGNVADGQSIFHGIVNTKTPVDTYCIGLAASIAGVIFLAGKKRYIVDYGYLMIHDPYVSGGGEISDELTKYLNSTRSSLLTMICARTGISEEIISKVMSEETWIDAEAALSGGYATDKMESNSNNVKKMTKEDSMKAKWQEYGLVLNKVLDKNNNKKMSIQKINAKLGLNEDAAFESTEKEISKLIAIKNKAEMDEDESNEDDDMMDKMKAELKEATDKYEDCMNELKALKDKMVEDKAKDSVANYVKLGKIKNEAKSIEKWTNMFIADFELAKDLVDELPVNKSAAKIETVNKVSDKTSAKYDAVARKMAEIANKLKK